MHKRKQHINNHINHQKQMNRKSELPLSNISSKQNNDHQEQLSEILKTNKILIENKRQIYETKIQSYDKKMIKIQQLIKTSTDREEKHNLYEKYVELQEKRKQSQLKLHKVAKIEMEMMEMEKKQEQERQNFEGQEEEYRQQWRIRTQSTCNNKESDKKNYLNKRINRSTSIQIGKNVSKAFSKTCKPFMQTFNQRTEQYEEFINPLEDSDFSVYSTYEQKMTDLDDKKTKNYLSKPLSIYNKLVEHQKGIKNMENIESEYNISEIQKYSGKKYRHNKYQSKSKSKQKQNNRQSADNADKNKIQSLQWQNKKLKQQLMSHKQQQIQLKQQKMKLIQTMTQLCSHLNCIAPESCLKASSSAYSKMITCNPQTFMLMFNQELNVVKDVIESVNITEKDRLNGEIQMKMVIDKNKKLGKNNVELIDKQRELLESIDQLEKIKQNTMNSIIQHLQYTCAQLGASQVKDHSSIEDRSNKIVSLFDTINKSIQIQKVTALQKKQMILSLDYKINILKSDEEKYRHRIEELQQQINEDIGRKKQLQKQYSRLNKDKQSLNLETNRLSEEVAEIQDLSGVRKNYYQQLQSKYNKLKSKKTKLQQSVQTLQKDEKQLQQSIQRIGQLVDRNEKYLNKINQEIKSRRMERQEMIKKCQQIDLQISDKDEQIKQIEKSLSIKKESMKKMDKKIEERQERIGKLEGLIKQLEDKKEEVEKYIEEKEEYIKNIIPQHIAELEQAKVNLEKQVSQKQSLKSQIQIAINQLSANLSQLQKQIATKQTVLTQMTKKQQCLFQENQQLTLAKQQLQQVITQMMQKKQQFLHATNQKCEQLAQIQRQLCQTNKFVQQKINQHEQLQEKIQQQINQLEDRQKQRDQLQQQISNAQLKLCEIIANIDMNTDEQQNIKERVEMLKGLQHRYIVQLAVRMYYENHEQKSQSDMDIDKYIGESMVNAEMKYKIQETMEQITGVKQLKEQYGREKQINRKLKLENDQYKKMMEIEESALAIQ